MERNLADRAQELATRIKQFLDLRGDIKPFVLNRVILMLSKEDRAVLRTLGALEQEWYLSSRETVEILENRCFTALNAIDLRACEAMPVRMQERITQRLMCDDAGNRIVIRAAPSYKGKHNPLTQKSNREQGIKWEHKAVVAPRVFPRHELVVAAANRVLEGRTLHLAVDFDGAAWDFMQLADELLEQLERDANLHALASDCMRVLQLIFDGHGWTSRSGAVRFVLRTPHTIKDHNSTRNARDPIFFIGTDKHAYLEKAVRIGGNDSLHFAMNEGMRVTELDDEEMPDHLNEPGKENLKAAMKIETEVILKVPRKNPANQPPWARGECCGSEECRLTQTGDCAAAHAGAAIDTPVCRHGACFRCLLGKKDWFDDAALETTVKRTFFYQCLANHVNPWPLLKGLDSKGKPWSERAPLKCPHCGETVDSALEKKDASELEAAPTEAKAKEIRRTHSKSHAAGMRGRVPVMPMDNKWRSRGVLHRRMNIVSNCIAATFMALPFCEKQRTQANELLKGQKMIWRCPETTGKRAKTISAGNDARRFLSDSQLLVGLFRIFYSDMTDAQSAVLDALGAAADANDGVRAEDAAPAPAPSHGSGAGSSAGQSRKAPVGVQGGGVRKPRTSAKKAVAAVVAPRGKQVQRADVRAYAQQRVAASAPAATPPADVPPAPAATDAAVEGGEEGDVEIERDGAEGGEHDDSLCPDEEDDDDMEEIELAEDERMGGLSSAIEVWLTAIRYTAALHATVENPFDSAAIKSHATKCGRTGRAWAVAMNDHSSNRCAWQYVHDAYAHIEEDILTHGPGDRNDDSILEKGNRRKKRLGDRCVFRGGTNTPGATWRCKYRCKEMVGPRGRKKWTGNYVTKYRVRKAMIGQAAQVQRLDMIAQIREMERATARAALSGAAAATQADQKAARSKLRDDALGTLEKFAADLKAGGKRARDAMDAELSGVNAGVNDAEEPNAGAGGAELPRGTNAPLQYTTSAASDVGTDTALVQRLAEIEAANMEGYVRNGEAFAAHFGDAKRVVHIAKSGDHVVGFAVRGPRERSNGGKVFMYELHVDEEWRLKGIGRGLLDIVAHLETPQGARSKRTQIELNVHMSNLNARSYYEHMGFKVPARNSWVSDAQGTVVAVVMRTA